MPRIALILLPVVLSFIVLGALLGFLASQAGISSVDIFVSSLLVYAGASQYAMVEMVANQVAWPTIVAVTFAINLRHCFMVASMSNWFSNLRPPLALFSVFFVTDESWALSMQQIRQQRGNIFFFLSVTLPLYAVWSLSTLVGWYLGEFIPDPETVGASFLSLAFFIALLGLFYERKHQIIPLIIAGTTATLSYQFLSETWYILIGGVLGALAAVFLKPRVQQT